MKAIANPIHSKLCRIFKIGVLTLATLVALSVFTTKAANIYWTNTVTADYTNNPAWAGHVVPVTADNAINDHVSSNNAARIKATNDDWTVYRVRAAYADNNELF